MSYQIPGEPLHRLQHALRLGRTVVTEMWSYPTGDWVSSVHAADIDGDGDIEVLLASRDCHVYALTKRGILKWIQEPSGEWVRTIRGIVDSEEVAGKTRIVIGSRNNKVQALDENGELLWTYQTNHVVRKTRVCDINNDGRIEILVASDDQCIYALTGETREMLWRYPTNGLVHTLHAADIDQDGEIEILAASRDQHVYVLDGYGQLKWKYDAKSEIYSIFSADIDGDGEIEILLTSNTKDLRVLTLQREEKWRYIADHRFLSLSVADLDGNGQQIIVVASEDKHIYFFNAQGQLLWRHNLNSRVFSVYAVDLDNDDLVEILAGTEDGIHVLRVKLIDELRETILGFARTLKQSLSAKHALSTAEMALLQDITNERPIDKREITLTSARQQMQAGDYSQALSTLVILQQQRIQVLWSRMVGHVRTVFSGDLWGNGEQGIVAGTDEGGIYVFDPRGELQWQHIYEDRIWTVYMGDIDQDGAFEVVAGSAGGQLSVFSNRGKLKWQSQVDDQIETVYIKEANQLDSAEMVIGSRGKQGKIHVYNKHFSPAIKPILTPHGVKVVGMHDLDGDGLLEIIAAGDDDKVYAYNRDGGLIWSYKTGDRAQGLSLRDIDADDQIEIVIGTEDRNVLVLDKEGNLRWRYYTSHRVLSTNTLDVDQDGVVEVCFGTEDGYIYFLNETGDLRWKYRIGDRVRGIQPNDVNNDGKVELIVGSEDQLLYLLQVLDLQEVTGEIEHCWQMLQQTADSVDGLLYELAHSPLPSLRSFALTQLIAPGVQLESRLAVLQELVRDTSSDVRHIFAQEIARLYQVLPHQARRFMDILLADQERDVRLALVDSLIHIAQIDSMISFQYLERFIKSVDGWVRRAVARKLYVLVETFPQRVFRLLMKLVHDEKEWVRQEAARALAHYFDLSEETVIQELRLLITNNVDLALLKLAASYATSIRIQGIVLVTVDLLMGLDEDNVLERLEKAVSAFAETRALKQGEEIWQIYRELYHLHRMRTIDEIAQYSCLICWSPSGNSTNFEGTLHVLQELEKVARTIATYLRRDRLGDRLASLLEAIASIEQIHLQLERELWEEKGQKSKFPDRLLLGILLTRWRNMTVAEIERLRGKADLKPSLRVKSARLEEQIGIWLEISNDGRSPADNVRVILKEGDDIEIVGEVVREFETIPAADAVIAEFTIKPASVFPRLIFELVFDDAEAKGKKIPYADRLEIREIERPFERIPNPYSIGTPIQKREMFYGREDDLEVLREDLISSPGNMVVVLYGQRRSGKSSLLYQLNNDKLAPHFCVYVDMQHETLNLTTGRLFYYLAFAIFQTISGAGLAIREPLMQDFVDDPTSAFDRFLDRAEAIRGQRKLVIMIDEFEIIEQKVEEKVLQREIFEYLRSLMQHRREVNFLLSGTHKIEQLMKDYWSVFFNIARHHRLSKLQEEAATLLITQPVREYVEYDPFAVEKIRQLAADQPYFIQLICRSLIMHCNEYHKNYITINDVNIVQERVMETGQVHFTWLWGRTSQQERLVLSIMAQEGGEEGRSLSLKDIKKVYQKHGLLYEHEVILRALENLVEGDVIERMAEGTRYRISIGLTRRWLLESKPLRRVLLEENLSTPS